MAPSWLPPPASHTGVPWEIRRTCVAGIQYDGCVAFERISVDPNKMAGAPCIRDLRFPVASVVAMVADGMSVDEILAEHPILEAADIAEAWRYAALAV